MNTIDSEARVLSVNKLSVSHGKRRKTRNVYCFIRYILIFSHKRHVSNIDAEFSNAPVCSKTSSLIQNKAEIESEKNNSIRFLLKLTNNTF